jgi:NADH-quinone oxidoreductase subunit F
VDIRTAGGPATAEEMAAVDRVLGAPDKTDHRVVHAGRAARTQRHQLLPVLHAIQDEVGWVSRGGLEYACRRLSVPPAEAYGVVSFYSRFKLEQHAPGAVHVCDDIVCMVAGARADHGVNCLGLCDRAPATLDEAHPAANATAVHGKERLLRRIGDVDPESIDSYQSHGGFVALARAREIGGAEVIRLLSASNLVGRGGAAFPTGRKWQSVATAPAPRYLVCNADESEPGTFKDRVLMEGDPFAIVEAMAIAAMAAGCARGYIYIRDEYPIARARMANAIAAIRGAGLLDIDIEVRRGAGAYICGEETALFNSIEG